MTAPWDAILTDHHPDGPLFTTAEAAYLCRITDRQWRDWCRHHRIPRYGHRTAALWPHDAIRRYQQHHPTRPAAQAS